MRNILLLAPNGQVGFELLRSLAPLGTIHTLSRSDVDFINVEAVIQKVSVLQPQIIVNAAAWTAVDRAETEVEAAFTLNAYLPERLAAYAQAHQVWLVHYSTDYVYPGEGTQAWQEGDATKPLSVYGQSKLEGDIAIQNSGAQHLIFRTSWVYAARGHNFMRTMLKLAQEREQLDVVADQVGSPTPARLIANVSALALHQTLTQPDSELAGVYHLVAKGYTSWYDFAQAIFKLARDSGIELTLPADGCQPIPSSVYPTPAQRPLNSRLSVSKLEKRFALQLPSWQAALQQTWQEL